MNSTDEVIHSLIFDVALKAVLEKIVIAVPFLGYPVIRPVFALIVNKLFELLYEELSTFVQFEVIDFQNAEKNKEYQNAVQDLKDKLTIPAAHWPTEKERQDAIDQSKAKFKETLRNLVHIPH